VDFVLARVEVIEQALRIDGSTGPSHGDKDFQARAIMASGAAFHKRATGGTGKG
jgi:hypothetical protein